MVAGIEQHGLIVTTSAVTSDELDKLAAHCNWPVVLVANARRLLHELTIRSPNCLLFWLECRQEILSSAKLIAWLRERGPRPLRIAIAHRLETDAEQIVRAAGAHAYLAVAGDIGVEVEEVLWPWIKLQGDAAKSDLHLDVDSQPHIRGPTELSGTPVPKRSP